MNLNKNLFLLLSTIFVCSIVAILFFQHSQEKAFRKTHLNTCLKNYNRIVVHYLEENEYDAEKLLDLLPLFPDSLLCIQVKKANGEVLLENFSSEELPTSLNSEKGIFLSKFSNDLYYYTISNFGDFKVTSALPYDQTFENSVRENRYFLVFVVILFLVVIVLIYLLSKHFYMIVARDEAKLKRLLTQNISHELKTPVSAILGYTETLLSNNKMPDNQKDVFVERSYEQAKRLQSLLEDITILNKLDDARLLYEKTHCNLCEIVNEVMQDCSYLIEKQKKLVEISLPDELPIFGNSSLLYSVFRNLLENALMYAGEDAKVSIILKEDAKRHYYFSFSDTGKGVAQEHLPHLFDRFYRVEKGRNRKTGGTGLGLAIVKNAIAFHQGSISVKNAIGGGLCFDFSLKKY